MERIVEFTEKRYLLATRFNKVLTKKQVLILGGNWNSKFDSSTLIGNKVHLYEYLFFLLKGVDKSLYLKAISMLDNLTPPVDYKGKVLQVWIGKASSRAKSKIRRAKKVELEKVRRERDLKRRVANQATRARVIGVPYIISLLPEDMQNQYNLKEIQKKSNLCTDDEAAMVYRLIKHTGYAIRVAKKGKATINKKSDTGKSTQQVYVIRAKGSNSLKIGISDNPLKRMSEIQTGNHETLELSMVMTPISTTASSIEKFLHKHFKKQKLRGEWFKDITNSEIIAAVGNKAIPN